MSKKNKVITVILILIIIISAVLGIVLYNKEHDINAKKDEKVGEEKISIANFKQKLEEAGIVIESETENEANEKIGASKGVTYIIDGKPIQVYILDENSEDELTVSNIKKAKEEGKVVMPSFDNYEFKVLYKDGLIIVNSEEHPQKDKIQEVFKNL